MPNYNPALTRSLWAGAQETLADSTLASPYTTVAVFPGPDPSGNPPSLTFFNTTPVAAAIYVATVDADGNYVADGTVSVAAGAVLNVPAPFPFVRALMAGAVASGTLVVTR
jgi:hypothetical protein